MLGFDLDGWDYLTFLAILVALIAVTAVLLWLAGLPGRIAIARKHPDAEAVKLLGWAGFLPVVPWIQAFVWAFKPTEVVDVRRFPAPRRAPSMKTSRDSPEAGAARFGRTEEGDGPRS